MLKKYNIILFVILYNFIEIQCTYSPTGDEVQAGSVLLPASRRGRYLANIVRRQAVDGTGIKFNKDADRMNAEAKKKVDVLSEELLPYIIAEQERRTTLYKRVMTAIQNGEKGVTIAEIRNKPPAIIRKGLMYRCPSNRAPKEPDGSGIIMCEDNIEPTTIMYESCLSAEDKDLYVADNKYFFCNRHKIEGPDLPRNGSTVIGCAPCERTSLNYTSARCALEDTDDVVVHYRYYPDRTYKFVTELDPDGEVCDHWNPCQIGYIFSLPSPDQALPANELWPDYIHDEELVPQDLKVEYVPSGVSEYDTTPPSLSRDLNKEFESIVKYDLDQDTQVIIYTNGTGTKKEAIEIVAKERKDELLVTLRFDHLEPSDLTKYYANFVDKNSRRTGNKISNMNLVLLLDLRKSAIQLTPVTIRVQPGTKLNLTRIHYSCEDCTPKNIVLRAFDGTVSNLNKAKYRVFKKEDDSELEVDLGETDYVEYGAYFVRMQLRDGSEENIRIINLQELRIIRHRSTLTPGVHYQHNIQYNCTDCQIIDIVNKGDSMLHSGVATHKDATNTIFLDLPSYSDDRSGVYIVIFTKDNKTYYAIAAIFDNVTLKQKFGSFLPPSEGDDYERTVAFTCKASCDVTKVMINGFALSPLKDINRIANKYGSLAYYVIGDGSIFFRMTSYTRLLAGVIQAEFLIDGSKLITKNVFEIGEKVKEVLDFSAYQDQESNNTKKPKNRRSGDENQEENSNTEESEGKRKIDVTVSSETVKNADEITTIKGETLKMVDDKLTHLTKMTEGVVTQ